MDTMLFIRSFFLFGHVSTIKKFISSEDKLNKITGQSGYNEFDAKAAFNEYERCEEVLRYGYPLTLEQRKSLNSLFCVIPTDHHVHNLYLGKYIGTNGRVCACFPIEIFILLLVSVVTLTSLTILVKIYLEVFTLQSSTSTVGFLATITLIAGIPLYKLYVQGISATYSYLSNRKVLNKLF